MVVKVETVKNRSSSVPSPLFGEFLGSLIKSPNDMYYLPHRIFFDDQIYVGLGPRAENLKYLKGIKFSTVCLQSVDILKIHVAKLHTMSYFLSVKSINWSTEKSQALKESRGICLEDVVFHIEKGDNIG
jgi:hypothetical protein